MRRKEFFYPSSDGIHQIHGILWFPSGTWRQFPKGIVQIAHGMVEYVGRYEGLARYLNTLGYFVLGNDHLGHGESVTSREDWVYFAAQDSEACVVKDMHRLTGMMKKRYPCIPYFLLGHSMGSFLSRQYMEVYGHELDGVILLGTGEHPAFLLRMGLVLTALLKMCRGERHRSRLLRRVMFGSYNRRIKNPRSANDWVCSDEKVMEAYHNDPACTFLFTVNGVETLMKILLFIGNRNNIEHVPKDIPILMASGREDPVGNYGKAVEKVYHRYQDAGIADITLKLFDNCRHELHNEINREKVYEMIGSWLESRSVCRCPADQLVSGGNREKEEQNYVV